MAGKKDKPALYELIKKGHATKPAWFRRKISAKKVSLLKSSSPGSAKQGAEPKEPGRPTDHRPSAPTTDFTPIEQAREGTNSLNWLTEKKLLFTCSYLVLWLGAAILILVLLISFWLGQWSVISHQADSTSPAGSDDGLAKELKELADSPPQKNVFSPPPSTANRIKTTKKPNTVKKTEDKVVPDMAGRHWVICGNTDKTVLGFVQKFFNNNGLSTLIRWSDKERRYVLVTAGTFTNSTSEKAKKIKTFVIDVGKKYNANKPDAAPSYGDSTFQGAYPIGADEIK